MAPFLSAGVLVLASVIVGGAALKACGRPVRTGYGPAVGLAVLLVVASVAIRLPGDVLTSVAACGVLVVGCAAWAGRGLLGPVERSAVLGMAAVAALLAVPYLVAGDVGILGVGINFDMSVHLGWAETMRADGLGEPLPLPGSGYPLGPHAVVATLGSALGVTTDDAFGGLALAVPPIAFFAALALLDHLPSPRRSLAAALTALPYLVAAYHGQGAFKETVAATLLLGFLALLREVARNRRLDWGAVGLMAVIGAGAFYNYSYLGLSWFAAALGIWLGLELVFGGGWVRPSHALDAVRGVRRLPRRSLLLGLGALGVVGAALAPEVIRALDFFDTISFSPDAAGGIATENVGNLPQALSPYEALGVWPKDDFRTYFESGERGFKALASGGIGVLAAAVGGAWWLRRRDFVVPAAFVSGTIVYLYLRVGDESVYVQAKALAVLAPVAMALSAGGLLAWRPARPLRARAVAVLTAVFVLGAGVSSFLAMRGSWVEPDGNVAQLDSLRPVVAGSSVLVIPTDFFAGYRLRGALVSGDVISHRVRINPRPQKVPDITRQRDFDWVTPQTLDRFDYVLTNRSRYQSEQPANFRRVRATASYALFKREGETPRRRILEAEGLAPGAVMNCSRGEGASLRRRTGWARVRPRPVVAIGPPGRRLPRGIRQSLEPEQSSRRRLVLSQGRWDLSMIYNGVRRPELTGAPLRFPADQVDVADTYWPLGEISWDGGVLELTVRAADLPLGAINQRADVGELAAVRVDTPARLVPLARACGRYVDWYTLGPERPPLPRAPDRD